MGLRLLQYRVNIKYEPGVNNPADYLSRHPVEDENQLTQIIQTDIERNEAALINCSALQAITVKDIAEATRKDEELQALRNFLQGGKQSETLKSRKGQIYIKVQKQLTYNDEENIYLKGDQIVLPESLRSKVLDLAHEGHVGADRMKWRIRQTFWFPGIEEAVTEHVRRCHPCLANSPCQPPPPIATQDLPKQVWERITVDFCGQTPAGTYLLLVVDEFSRYPFVIEVASTGHQSTIKALDNLFCMFGSPKVLKSDNGPPFNGKEFAEFLQTYDIKHQNSTPIWPAANGMVERIVRSVKNSMRATILTQKNWKSELPQFLLAYRNTPHSVTRKCPAELFLRRRLRDKLNITTKQTKVEDQDKQVTQRDARYKAYNKKYADERRRARFVKVQVGDCVLVRFDKRPNSFSPRYNPQPYRIIRKKGTRITARNRNGHVITRNESWFIPATEIPEKVEDKPKTHWWDRDRSDEPLTFSDDMPEQGRDERHLQAEIQDEAQAEFQDETQGEIRDETRAEILDEIRDDETQVRIQDLPQTVPRGNEPATSTRP